MLELDDNQANLLLLVKLNNIANINLENSNFYISN